MTSPQIVAWFFGDGAATPAPGGVSPFALLGIRRRQATVEEIDEALAARLQELDRHPQSRSIEADEVRDALAVAAAQLRDASLREHFRRGTSSGSFTQSMAHTAASPDERAELRRVLAASGGWNRAAQRLMASSRLGVDRSPGELAGMLRAAAGPRRATDLATPAMRIRRLERPTPPPPAWMGPATAATWAASGVLGVVLAIILLGRPDLGGGNDGGATADRNATAVEPQLETRAGPTASLGPVEQQLARAIDEVGAARGDDLSPAVIDAVEQFADSWTTVPAPELERFGAAVVAGFRRDATDTDEVAPSIQWLIDECLREQPGELARHVWVEAFLGAVVGADIGSPSADAALLAMEALRRRAGEPVGAQGSGQLWIAHARAAVRRAGRHALRTDATTTNTWNEIARLIEAVTPADSPGRSSLVTEMMDAGLRRAPFHSAPVRSLARLVADLPQVVAWLDDASLTSGPLGVLIDSLPRSLLGGEVETSLDAGSPASHRIALRDELARRAGLPTYASPASDEPSAWSRSAGAALGRSAGTAERSCTVAAELAWVNTAAALVLAGDADGADAALERAASISEGGAAVPAHSADQRTVSAADLQARGRGSDGRWVLDVHRAGDEETDLVNTILTLEHTGPGGPADGDFLGELASHGSPLSARRAAQRVVRRHPSNVWVLNGLLEALPRASRVPEVSTMLELVTGAQLPRARDAAWRVEAHRALLETLMEHLAHDDDVAQEIDAASREIALAAMASASAASPTPIMGQAEPAVAARRLWRALLGAAQPSIAPGELADAETIERRVLARRRVTTGGARRFVAEQTGVVEALALVAVGERPGERLRARAIIEEATAARLSAATVFDQVLANERAMTRLWRLRLGTLATNDVERLAPNQDAPRGQEATGRAMVSPRSFGAIIEVVAAAAMGQVDNSASRGLPGGTLDALAALDPSDPMAYFELGEDLAYWSSGNREGPTAEARQLAAYLFVLAYELDRRRGGELDLGRSACLALLELTPEDEIDRIRWLEAMAGAIGGSQREMPAYAPRPRLDPRRAQLAELIVRFRGGHMRRASRYLMSVNTAGILRDAGFARDTADRIVAMMTRWVERLGTADRPRVRRRPAPGGFEYVLDRDGRGNPGPPLSERDARTLLEVEMVLLDAGARIWSLERSGVSARPVREIEPRALAQTYGVDADRAWWRNGRWAEAP
ncbi:MAG: hypothetical protein AAGI30_02650 [Planctomycetota bacterium]